MTPKTNVTILDNGAYSAKIGTSAQKEPKYINVVIHLQI